MFAQVDFVPVASPHLEWAGLMPLVILGGGAVLLVMFRSVVKRLPAEYENWVTTAMGPVAVIAAYLLGGVAGHDLPLSGIRSDAGDGWFYLGFVVVLAVAALLVWSLDIGLDTAFTVGVAFTTLTAAWMLWIDRITVDGAFNSIGDQLGVDGFSVVFTGIMAIAVGLTALLLDDYIDREGVGGVEMYVLLMLSAAGGVVMASANGLIVLFLGLETLSIAVYVLAAMHSKRLESQEAGLKYFVLGAFSSAFLLYGIAFVYGATGSTNLIAIRSFLDTTTLTDDAMLLAGFGMMLVGLGFKVAAVPFHSWTPDVYQGAPTPVVAWMASAVKAAGFAAMVRVFVVTFGSYRLDWQPAVYVLAILTLVTGSVLAVVQRDAKRMLAYSSISHAGFILVGVQAASARGTAAVVFYAAAYTFLVIGSFAVLTVVSGKGDRATTLDDLDGLADRRPALALAFTIFLLAQAGVPLTTGFVAKIEVIGAAVEARSYWLAITAMLTAVISSFLYLRIVLAMYVGKSSDEAMAAPRTRVPTAAILVIVIAFVVTVGFGIIPDPIDQLARDAVPQLVAAG